MISGASSVSLSKRATNETSNPISRARSETDSNLPSSSSFCQRRARAPARQPANSAYPTQADCAIIYPTHQQEMVICCLDLRDTKR